MRGKTEKGRLTGAFINFLTKTYNDEPINTYPS